MWEDIQKKAWEILLNEKIQGEMTLADLEEIGRKRGFRICSYSQKAKEIEQSSRLKKLSRIYDSFTATDGGVETVFYRDNLSSQRKIQVVACELGHFVLGHRKEKESKEETPEQEKDAAAFAWELLLPSIVLDACHIRTAKEMEALNLFDVEGIRYHLSVLSKKRKNSEDSLCRELLTQYQQFILAYRKRGRKRKIPFAVCAGLTVLLATACAIGAVFERENRWLREENDYLAKTLSAAESSLSQLQKEEEENPSAEDENSNTSSDFAETKEKAESVVSEEVVFLSPSGEKYHRADCRYVGDNFISMSQEEAAAEGYEPCSVCCGDLILE